MSIDEITGTKVVSHNDLLHIGTDYGGWVVPKDLLNADSTCYCVVVRKTLRLTWG
ncbi:MAG: hypothetical protein RMY28_031875 [Nostoc sp. ChiSLP01]